MIGDGLGPLDVREVPRVLDCRETRAGNGLAIGGPVVAGCHEAIVRAPQDERRYADAAQAPSELRVVEVGLPRIERGGLAIAGDDGELIVGELRAVEGGAGGIRVRQTKNLGGMERE